MPSVERVMQEIKGADPLETAARQSAAFWQLEDMIQVLSDGRYFRRQLSPDEESIIKSYKSANGAIHREIGKHFPEGSPKSGPDSPSLKWMNRTSRLQGDKGFQTELLDKFFSPAWKTRFQLAQVNQNQRIAVQQAELARATQGPARAGSAVWGDGKRNEQPGAAEINAIPEVLAAFGQMAANTQRNTYAEACKKRKLEVKGTPLKGLYVSASGAWLDFSCGAADLCGESAPFYEYEVKGNQVLVGRFQLTRTPDGNLSGPRVITVTVDRAAARVNFQTVYQSVQKECPIGTLRKSDKSSPYD